MIWKLKTSERHVRWRDFRNSLSAMTLEEALIATQDFWASVPFAPYYLDPDRPEEWPNPWDLITENYYCDLAKALGIVYTVYFSQHGKDLDLEIRVYYDLDTEYVYNLAVFDQGKYVINLVEGEIVNIESVEEKLNLKRKFGIKELKLEEY